MSIRAIAAFHLALALTGIVQSAEAFEECDTVASDRAVLARHIKERAVHGTPMKYHAVARTISLVTDGPTSTLFPTAGFDPAGTRAVLFPHRFGNVLCTFVLVNFIINEGIQEKDYEQAVYAASQCLASGRARRDCIVDLSADLRRRYKATFAKLSDSTRGRAINFYWFAVYQLAMHEYAHHFLDHFDRIKSGLIVRIDAEFEADYFAIMNGLQQGEPAVSMSNLFMTLAEVEKHSKVLATPEYESGKCRNLNILNIASYTYTAPAVVIDIAAGGPNRLGLLEVTRKMTDRFFDNPPPEMWAGSCGKLGGQMLNDSFKELRRLYLRIKSDSDTLLAEKPDLDRSLLLIRDLSSLAGELIYVNSLSASAVSIVALRMGLYYDDKLIVESLSETEAVKENMLSRDYGRILGTRGLFTLQSNADLSVQDRLKRGRALLERAVYFHPDLAESWMNLAFIAFMEGDCGSALEHTRRAAEAVTREREREQSSKFAADVTKYADDLQRCEAEGAKFRKRYFGE